MASIVSWNVAGLSTTVQRIHDSYGINRKKPAAKKQNGGTNSFNKSSAGQCPLACYFERHGSPDIVCLQEHKIPRSLLSSRSEPKSCAHVEGYESFWSCCVDEKSKGMNGVVTYAKKGTVLKANSSPFRESCLNEQGRCVMSDHGNFVVFNVYAPAGGRGLTKKMHFLQALRRAMKEQRDNHNKAVVLVGDLNISHGPLDVYWKHRVLHINDILGQVQQQLQQQQLQQQDGDDDFPRWKQQLAQAWPSILEAMKTKKVVPTQTSNSLTGAKYDRFRLCVVLENPTRTIFLGKHESCEDYCYHGYDFESPGYYHDPETDKMLLGCEANVVSIDVLAELMIKLAKIEWTEDILREIASSPDAGRARVNPPRQWLNCLLKEDDMVDAFRHFYPSAEARFTCWHQFTNTRYSNNGTRIDYTIVDRSLLPFVQQGGSLRTGKSYAAESSTPDQTNASDMDPLTEEAALAAATARGLFEPVSFEGGGIVEPTHQALDTQFGPLHTGMIYTPPSFSDHIAVSLLLADCDLNDVNACHHWRSEDWGKILLDEKDPATKRAQPHKVQKSIASFFSSKKNDDECGSEPTQKRAIMTSYKQKLPQKRPATVLSFFQPKDTAKESQNIAKESQNIAPNSAPRDSHNINARQQKTKISQTGALAKNKKANTPSILTHFARK